MNLIPSGLTPDLEQAWERLLHDLKKAGSCLVAFSGGVDSALLLAAARAALGRRALAAICTGPFTPPWELTRARAMAQELGVELLEIESQDLSDPAIALNDRQRCYHCKHNRMKALKELAREKGLELVAEGSQADDKGEDRPGSRAVAELGVASPLATAGLSKKAVRDISRALGLVTAETPSSACLATRVPMGTPLRRDALARIAVLEGEARQLVPGQLRARDHFPWARLELDPDQVAQAARPRLREKLLEAARKAGYRGLALDLAGYRSGGADMV